MTNEPQGDLNDKLSCRKEETLTFTLHFDTYMKGLDAIAADPLSEREDVRKYTDPIVKLAVYPDGKIPHVCFLWGSLRFQGFITSVNQKFTMFMDDGKPVRAVLEVSMKGGQEYIAGSEVKANTIDLRSDDWKQTAGMSHLRDLLDYFN